MPTTGKPPRVEGMVIDPVVEVGIAAVVPSAPLTMLPPMPFVVNCHSIPSTISVSAKAVVEKQRSVERQRKIFFMSMREFETDDCFARGAFF